MARQRRDACSVSAGLRGDVSSGKSQPSQHVFARFGIAEWLHYVQKCCLNEALDELPSNTWLCACHRPHLPGGWLLNYHKLMAVGTIARICAEEADRGSSSLENELGQDADCVSGVLCSLLWLKAANFLNQHCQTNHTRHLFQLQRCLTQPQRIFFLSFFL